MTVIILGVLAGCVIGNIGYAAYNNFDWHTAIVWTAAQSSMAAAQIGVLAFLGK